MKIYVTGVSSSYEIEHLVRVFYKDAQISATRVFANADLARAHLGKKHLFCALRKDGKVFWRRAKIDYNSDFKGEFQLATLMFLLLRDITKINPPWGLLTGVRPVRIIHDMRKKAISEGEIEHIFLNKYFVQKEKFLLAKQVAKLQTPIMAQNTSRSYSLYISIPFCPSRCSYCSFVSRTTAQSKALIAPYVALLQQELISIAQLAQSLNLTLETVYIGGGTPTSLDENQLETLMKTVANCFDLSKVKEYTVEAGRPDCTTKEKLHIIKNYGASRISINPQTLQDDVLKRIGRAHNAQDIIDCFNTARMLGHNNINMDLIAGLPGDTVQGFEQSLKGVIALNPENITVHTLTLKRASNIVLQNQMLEDISPAKMLQKCKTLEEFSYLPYYLYRQKNTLDSLENTGYCKQGFEGLYNVFIMEEVHTILSAGAGGSTKLVAPNGRIERIFNFKYAPEYVTRFTELQDKKKGVIDFYAGNMDS